MKTKLKQNLTLLCLIAVLVLPFFVFAANPENSLKKLQNVGEGAGFEKVDSMSAAAIAGKTVNVIFSILGIVFLFYTLLAGYHYMTAQGNETKTKDALTTIRNSIIGLIIMLGAWAIYSFVWDKIAGI